MTGDRGDALRDAAALIRATVDRDHEGARIVLDYSDNGAVAEILAIVISAACRAYGPDFTDDLTAELRGSGQEGSI